MLRNERRESARNKMRKKLMKMCVQCALRSLKLFAFEIRSFYSVFSYIHNLPYYMMKPM